MPLRPSLPLHSFDQSKAQDQPRIEGWGSRDWVRMRSCKVTLHRAWSQERQRTRAPCAGSLPSARPSVGLGREFPAVSVRGSLAVRGEGRTQLIALIQPGQTCDMSFQRQYLHQTIFLAPSPRPGTETHSGSLEMVAVKGLDFEVRWVWP